MGGKMRRGAHRCPTVSHTAPEVRGGQTNDALSPDDADRALSDALICIRALRPDDGPRLVAFHATLSPDTLVSRYGRRVAPLSLDQAERLARAVSADHTAIIATLGPARDAPILAEARYDRTGGDEAEVGLVVADAWQARGIGRALFAHVVEHARSRGATIVRAVTQARNARVLAMARHAGYPCSARQDGPDVELVFDIRSGPIGR